VDDDDWNRIIDPGPNVPTSSELEDQIEELSEHVRGLESSIANLAFRREGLSLGYALGMVLAVVLSWARNGSILWCIGHGPLSWAYVVWFAVTRK
jgi:hypothetical protein